MECGNRVENTMSSRLRPRAAMKLDRVSNESSRRRGPRQRISRACAARRRRRRARPLCRRTPRSTRASPGRRRRVGERGLLQKALGDFASAAAADRRDAGDGQHVLDSFFAPAASTLDSAASIPAPVSPFPAGATRNFGERRPRANPISNRRRQAGGRPRRSRKVFTSRRRRAALSAARRGSPGGVKRDA